MAELAKTTEGRARIEAAVSRLDKTVADLGQPHRTDLPQGEIASEVVQNQPDDVVPPQFLPLRKDQIAEPPTIERNESREVPPPAEEAGVAETHSAGPAVGFEFRLGPSGGFDYANDEDGRADNVQEAPGMEVDVIDHSGDELKDLMKVLDRNDREEVQAANAES